MNASQSQPLFYSPALPSELLWYIIHRCSYPTTLIVCSSRLEFLAALARDIKRGQQQEVYEEQSQGEQEQGEQKTSFQPEPDQEGISTDTQHREEEPQESSHSQLPRPSQQQQAIIAPQPTQDQPTKTTTTATTTKITPGPGPGPSPWVPSQLLASPLYQLAVTRHIRTVFIPTVSHLRAFLSVFDPSSTNSTNNSSSSTGNKVPAPPPPPPYGSGSGPDHQPGSSNHGGHQTTTQRIIIVYGFLALHRDSSEWSVQGLNNSVAVLLEAGRRVGLGVVVVEPVGHHHDCHDDDEKKGVLPRSMGMMMESLLGEKMPVVSGSALKGTGAGDLERSVGIAGKTVDVRRVLGRWFRFGVGEWERERERGCCLER
ncbi:hypothetical protein B0H65DRAFT_551854 [Neurospora tetraspora]|uniref:Uncharacterized protein n=1 Tax=Neurospora tetraspora TaxID=94610 RepID=A0AAE0MP99_9PEZI|nr:hypothetical protein B0H65DRAFT_551854 [Neurospora tetraspora]